MKKALKYLKRGVILILALIIIYFSLAFILSILSTSPQEVDCQNKKEIFLSTNGVHLDIIIPKENLNSTLPNIPPNIKYLSFGWGDKGFYLKTPTWDKLKFSTAVKALFWKSETAMHVTYHKRKRQDWMSIKICDSQLKNLTTYLFDSFAKNAQGNTIKINGAGYSNNDEFYEAIGSYDCINTCNSWVNRGLKNAQIKTSIWSPFDKGIIYQISKN